MINAFSHSIGYQHLVRGLIAVTMCAVAMSMAKAADDGRKPRRAPPIVPRRTIRAPRIVSSPANGTRDVGRAGPQETKNLDDSKLTFETLEIEVLETPDFEKLESSSSVPQTPWPVYPFARSLSDSLFQTASASASGSDNAATDQVESKFQPEMPAESVSSLSPPIWADDFSPTPIPQASMVHRPDLERNVYVGSGPVPTQAPWIEWGRQFYGSGITPKAKDLFGDRNPLRPEFYLYGDMRTGIAAGRNAAGRTDNWANRLNLDADFRMTSTERFHAFVGPLDDGGAFTRWERVAGDFRFRNEIDFTPVTAFFEGDLGAMVAGAADHPSRFDLPFTVGLVPLLFQNGIWMEDAVTGAAFALPSRHSNLLNWSNFDATFFAVFDQLNSVAFGADENAAQAFGTAWFIEAYGGYIETGYAYVRDRNIDARSYHNATFSFTRRYLDRISNSVRVIVNAGQDLPDQDRTADGALLLVENSWITADPLRFVPYANFFVGWDRPQSVARAGVSGGILRNTGINFDTDGLNGFATLDPTGSDTAGGSVGVDLIGNKLDRQWIVEATYLTPHGSKNALVPDDQYGLGTRYQFPVSHRTLIRMDAMYGWRQGLGDVYGTRIEYRWKF